MNPLFSASLAISRQGHMTHRRLQAMEDSIWRSRQRRFLKVLVFTALSLTGARRPSTNPGQARAAVAIHLPCHSSQISPGGPEAAARTFSAMSNLGRPQLSLGQSPGRSSSRRAFSSKDVATVPGYILTMSMPAGANSRRMVLVMTARADLLPP